MRTILTAAALSTKPASFINGVLAGVFAAVIDINVEHDGSGDFGFIARFDDMNAFGDLYLDCDIGYNGVEYNVLIEVTADSEWKDVFISAVGKLPVELVQFITDHCEIAFNWTIDPFECRDRIIKLF